MRPPVVVIAQRKCSRSWSCRCRFRPTRHGLPRGMDSDAPSTARMPPQILRNIAVPLGWWTTRSKIVRIWSPVPITSRRRPRACSGSWLGRSTFLPFIAVTASRRRDTRPSRGRTGARARHFFAYTTQGHDTHRADGRRGQRAAGQDQKQAKDGPQSPVHGPVEIRSLAAAVADRRKRIHQAGRTPRPPTPLDGSVLFAQSPTPATTPKSCEIRTSAMPSCLRPVEAAGSSAPGW